MKILTIKLQKGRVIAAALLLAGLALAATATVFLPKQAMETAASAGAKEEERIAFLSEFGWQVAERPLIVSEALVSADPKDKDYAAYARLQKPAGLSLEPVRGKRVKCYVYEVTNHPAGRSDALGVLLVHSGQIVGGHIQLGQGEDALRHSLANRTGELTEKQEQTTASSTSATASSTKPTTPQEKPASGEATEAVDGQVSDQVTDAGAGSWDFPTD